MVLFPVAGKPVRHTACGLGNEECPMTERRAENWASRHGYVVLSCSTVASTWMVIGVDVPGRARIPKSPKGCDSGFHRDCFGGCSFRMENFNANRFNMRGGGVSVDPFIQRIATAFEM